jgi:hypothetical protein
MDKENILKVLVILEGRFEIGTQSKDSDYYVDGKFLAGIWMHDLTDANLSVEVCWDVLSILSSRIDGFKIVGKFQTGYENQKYEDLASKVDELPPIFEVLLPENFIVLSKKIRNDLHNGKNKIVNIKDGDIVEMDVLEDKTGKKKVTVYVNVDYARPLEVNRRKYWGMMYELADMQSIPYDKSFFDYFNSNKSNPLYSERAFRVTQILKKEYDTIKPKVRINIISQKKVSQRLKTA